MIWKRFKSTIRENKLLEQGQKVGVALSGGKDSTVLLYLLNQLKDHLDLKLKAITLDEGIKGYRESGLKLSKKMCKELGVEHHIISFKDTFGKTMDQIVKDHKEVSPCYFCGVFRRYLLNKTARELKLDVLATGHNLDDESQVVLMNLMRGNSGKMFRIGARVGIKGFDQFVPRVKPLRDIPEREVAVYALLKGYPADFHSDCPYVTLSFRDSLRSHLNQLEEEFPGTKIAVLRTFDQFKKAKSGDYPLPNICPNCGELTSSEVCKTCKILENL
jgi:uncharacterized protein (TIGR00269 family)